LTQISLCLKGASKNDNEAEEVSMSTYLLRNTTGFKRASGAYKNTRPDYSKKVSSYSN
jgi:hypothetical protein